jgi:putative acetyltransferase
MTIRTETIQDIQAIDRVVVSAFPTNAEAALVHALRTAGKLRVSLVAEQSGRVVGHVAFSPVTLEPPHRSIHLLGLAPLAVLPEFQRQGIGSELIERGLEACRNLKIDSVVVLGHPEFYGRFGFRPASGFGLRNEYGAGDAFMAIELQMSCFAGVNALVKYAPQFADL